MKNILFFNADITTVVRNKTFIRKIILNVFKKEKVAPESISYIFCSDEYLLKMNKQFLDHNTLTDVITFPLSEPGAPVIAEVYISIERIKENAKIFKVSYQNELLRVMIHGALHLCGYKDKTSLARQKMRSMEDYYLRQFNVSREANT